ncbi:hypothetical protein ACWGJP_12835 [Microbacterium sp. NPDC055903]
MTSDADDALSWEGDEEREPAKPALPQGWNAVGKGSEQVGRIEKDGAVLPSPSPAQPAQESTGMLLFLGLIGGVYLLYSIGWVIGGLNLRPLAGLIVSDAMYLPWQILAVAAPALWMLTVWVLTRRSATWIRVLLLLVGAVLLVPWPFVMVGVSGA